MTMTPLTFLRLAARLGAFALACCAAAGCGAEPVLQAQAQAPAGQIVRPAASGDASAPFAALRRSAGPEDVPFRWEQVAAGLSRYRLRADAVRRLALDHDPLDAARPLRLWLAPGRDAYCLIQAIPPLPLTGGNDDLAKAQCFTRREAHDGKMVSTFLDDADPSRLILIGVVPDDVVAVGIDAQPFVTPAIVRNTWVATARRPSAVTLRFADGDVRRVPIRTHTR